MMKRILLLLALLAASPLSAQTIVSRRYWVTSIDTLWIGHQKHTHTEVTGRVVYRRWEDDGDRHIKIASLSDSTKFIIAECIPALPCRAVSIGEIITVRGISRYDPEHDWREVHPVEWINPPL